MRITHTQVCMLLHAAADLLEEPARSTLINVDTHAQECGASLCTRIEGIAEILAENYPLGAHEAAEVEDEDDF